MVGESDGRHAEACNAMAKVPSLFEGFVHFGFNSQGTVEKGVLRVNVQVHEVGGHGEGVASLGVGVNELMVGEKNLWFQGPFDEGERECE